MNAKGFTDLAAEVFDKDSTIIVMNKTDLLPPELTKRHADIDSAPVCWISCKTGDGVSDFMNSMKLLLEQM